MGQMPPGDLTSVVGDGDVMAFCAADEVRVYDLESGSTLAVSGGVETVSWPNTLAFAEHVLTWFHSR